MSKTLFEITGDALALYDLLEETGGEVNEDTEKIIDRFFAEIASDREKRLTATAR